MEIRLFIRDIKNVLLIPVYTVILLTLIIIGLFRNRTINQTLDEIVETREY